MGNNINLAKSSEEQIAKQILKRLTYSDKNIAIPIIKIAKNSGFKVYHENFFRSGESEIAGKLLIGDISKEKYGSSQVILVNRGDHLFAQRLVVAKMLGSYLVDGLDEQDMYSEDLSTSLTYEKIYDKQEDFALNILAPDNIFIHQYNLAINNGLPPIGVTSYLSRFFEVPEEFVYRRVKSLTRM